jgi:hypothetical protein
VTVGGQTTVTVALANGGPDDAPGVTATVQIPGFAASGASPSRGGRARDVVLASRRFGRASGRRTATLVPSRRRLGRHRRPFTLRVRILARDAAGNATVVTRSVRVTLGRRARRR